MKNLWKTYKSAIYRNCTEEMGARNSVYYWKNKLFATTVIYVIPFSLIALMPGIYMAAKVTLWGMLISDFISVAGVLAVAFVPKLSLFTRKLLFSGLLYQTSVVMLYYLGSNGPGLLYLFAITVFVLFSLGRWYGYVAFGLNTAICIFFGVAIHYGVASHILLGEYQLDSWIGVSSNLIFLSGIAVFLIPKLFNGLQNAFEEQVHLRAELEKSVDDLNTKNEELEQFAYTISHDLKEPLRMVRSFMKLLKKKYGDQLDEKAEEYIHYAVDGAQRMGKNIDDLLEYSRIGRKYKTVEKTDLNTLLDEVLKNLQTKIKAKNADISVADLPTLPIVPVAMKMLFQNLIANSLKYQPQGNNPMITVEAEEQDKYWNFSVSDNGIGIDPKYHKQIFSVFKRLHTRDEYPGNGMGLAICKKVVEHHGGSIMVESKGTAGSAFIFTVDKTYFASQKVN